MHKESRREMRRNLSRYANLQKNNVVLDVGSYDVNGTYKCLIPENNKYIGVDMAAGPNVDLVMLENVIPLEDNSVDIVLCGQVLEHCKNPFKLVEDIHRVLKVGGMAFLVAPFICPEHRFPVDCFRYLPDGMISIMESSKLRPIKAYLHDAGKGTSDCWGIGKK